ncbi:polymorphic transmembrane cluster 2 transmembrane protein 11 [Biomphalaria pfeifferi]|uniref:Polymorphic transmembrane cluster 2 transmembrane protein 11 n=1 Tax=Biomphalaria pfeifferi TaxID=112525 RepID=A0AAD8C5I5_BIOPF|nr:polymorphic transmembrane cluster 2 transmembrane protein 11 [Biomphalaria pfeifferi]
MIVNCFKASFIILTIKILLSDSITLVCPKVLHENSNVTVSTEFSLPQENSNPSIDTALEFYRNNEKILTCVLNKKNCSEESDKITLNYTGKFNSSHANIMIKLTTNTSWRQISLNKSSIEEWTVQLGHDVSKCNITYYAIFDKPECFSLENSKITCTLKKVFPEALCEVKIIHNNNTDSFNGSVVYNHTKIYDGDYYETSCTFNTLTRPENESYYVEVTMYPDITGNVSDRNYGETKTFQFPDSQSTTTEPKFEITSPSLLEETKNRGIGLVIILTGSCVGLLILITIAVIVIILIFKKTKGIYYCTCCWYTSLYNNPILRQKVTVVNNSAIYSLNLPRPKVSIDDSYSNVNKLQTGFKVSPSEDLNATILKSNQPMIFDVGNVNCKMYTEKEPDIYFNGDTINSSGTNIKHKKCS